MIGLHTLKSYKRTSRKRIGRGHGSGLGTTAGKGTKGQRARTGGRKRVARRSLKSLIERLPKVRGMRAQDGRKHYPVSLRSLEKRFAAGATITPAIAITNGLIHGSHTLAIVGPGPLTKALTVHAHKFSASAKEAILKAGGKAVRVPKPSERRVLTRRRRNARV